MALHASAEGSPAQGDFSQGGIGANLLRQAAPTTVALLVNAFYNVVDRIFIGHIPENGVMALTGVGLAFPVISVVAAFYNLCATGNADFSIHRGNGDDRRAACVQDNIFILLLVFSAILLVAGQLAKAPVLRLIGASPATFGFANDYLTVYLLGTPFVLLSLGLNPLINAQGAPRTAMFSVLIGAVANVILDPIFIFRLGLGVRGAALATVLSQLCSAIWVMAYLCRRAPVRLHPTRLRSDGRVMLRILSLGVSGFTMQVTNSAVSMMLNSQLYLFGGDLYVSAMTVVNTLREVTFVPVSGVMQSIRPIIGFNYGAKRYDRVRQTILLSLKLSLVINLAVWLVFQLIPGVFVRMLSNEAALLPIAEKSIRIFFSLVFMMSFMLIAQNVFVSLGYAGKAMFFSFFRKVVLVVPLAYLLPRLTNLGPYSIFLSEPISEFVGGLVSFLAMMLTVWPKLKSPAPAQTEDPLPL